MGKDRSLQVWRNFKGLIDRLQVLTVLLTMVFCALSSPAIAETRSLKLYYLHTGEKSTITFKQNGKFLEEGLKKVNWFLRDWRRNEPTEMDPRLLDLVWEVYKESGSSDYIHVISGYRSPATNKLLRKRGRGVASKSQHIRGKALDFYLPDVKLSKLHRIAMRKQHGGVGYYPKSGSPFVHMDTGRVRHWPRLSRSQLAKIFPNGNTLHVPTDGKPFTGFDAAKRKYDRYRAEADQIVVVKASATENKPGFFRRLLSKEKEADSNTVDEAEDTYANTTPAPTPVKTVEVSNIPVPLPAPRDAEPGNTIEVASALPQVDPVSQEPSRFLIPVPIERPEYSVPEEPTLAL